MTWRGGGYGRPWAIAKQTMALASSRRTVGVWMGELSTHPGRARCHRLR